MAFNFIRKSSLRFLNLRYLHFLELKKNKHI